MKVASSGSRRTTSSASLADARPDRIDLVERARGFRLLSSHALFSRDPFYAAPPVLSTVAAATEDIGLNRLSNQRLVTPALMAAAPGKSSTPCLEDLVADRQHVVAARECRAPARPAAWPRAPAPSPRPRPWCRPRPAPARGSPPPRSRVRVWREPRMQAASALRSELVCSAKARKIRPCGSVTSASDGASSASAIAFRQADAVDQAAAEPAEDDAAHARRMRRAPGTRRCARPSSSRSRRRAAMPRWSSSARTSSAMLALW